MLGRPFKWTDQNREQARIMWEKDCTLTQIAAALRIHKGAISGYTGRNRDIFPRRVVKVKQRDLVVSANKRMPWTRERLLKAAALWSRNVVITSMAESMDVSTAAMGDVIKRYPQYFPERVRPNSGASAIMKAVSLRFERERKATERSQRGFDSSIFAIPGVKPVLFIDLVAGQCKFPISAADGPSDGSMPCCGAKAGDGSHYCNHHHRLAYPLRAVTPTRGVSR